MWPWYYVAWYLLSLVNMFQILWRPSGSGSQCWQNYNSMGKCKRDVISLLTHWSYIFLALTNHIYNPDLCPSYHTPCTIYRARDLNNLEIAIQWRHNEREASQIIAVSVVYSTVCSGVDQRKHQSSAPLAFVSGIHRSSGIHRWPVNSPHKGPVTQKMLPFDDVIWSGGQKPNDFFIISGSIKWSP